MSISSVTKAIELLKPSASLILGGVSPEMIKAVEAKLGVELPPSFVVFLREVGYCLFGAYTFSGIPNKPNYLELGIVRETLAGRQLGLPKRFIVIAETGDGLKYLLDTLEKDSQGESPVDVWDVYPTFNENQLTKVYQSYGDFLLDIVEEILRTRREMEDE
jgi:SMI1-KNR4 cell-wall